MDKITPQMVESEATTHSWLLPNNSDAGEIKLGNQEEVGRFVQDNEETRWSLNTILIISLGPLGVVLLVSYIVHWYQVAQKVVTNRKIRKYGDEDRKHPKASAMLSIRALERESAGTFTDMAVDIHDEYDINRSRDMRLK